MAERAYLILEDGSVYRGWAFGAVAEAIGEVVFDTSMTGYQEMLTDPSFAGQIVVPTFPIVGNYGVNDDDFESRRIWVRGFVVREDCEQPSHYRSRRTLSQYLAAAAVPGVYGIDTRALVRKLRTAGVMLGAITSEASVEAALDRLRAATAYEAQDFVRQVTTDVAYAWGDAAADGPHVVVLDIGLKYTILRILQRLGCRATVVPATTSADDILALRPDGVLLSPGPGDPERLDYIVDTVRALLGRRPIMGICLGHQVLGIALGGRTFKLKFGHRGGNHPVKDLSTGQVHITSQNHGYAIDADSLPRGVEVSHLNLNDNTVEGIAHRDLPIVSIQYHSEGAPGPWDNEYLFDRWLAMVRG